MRRAFGWIAVFLVLGAIVNVAVAWTFGALDRPAVWGTSGTGGTALQCDINWWLRVAPDSIQDTPTTRTEHRSWKRRMSILWDDQSNLAEAAYRYEYGWPFLSLEWSSWVRFIESDYEAIHAIELRSSTQPVWFAKPRLPLRPIFPAFIINTLFYALLLWLLFFAPFAARRKIRRRRGQCEKCAYPIGVSPVCTECGAAVSQKVTAER